MLIGYAVLTVSLILIGLVLTHVLDSSVGDWDNQVNRWLASRRTGTLDSLTGFATTALETLPVVAVAVIVVGVLVWRRRIEQALVIVFGLVLEILVFLSVTFIVARPRPAVPRLNSTPMTSSFPSGHTAAAVVLYGGIALVVWTCTRDTRLRCLAGLVALVVGFGVAFSRVYRGMHHPTDVIVGACFGIACLCFALHAARAVFAAPAGASAPAVEPEARAEPAEVSSPVGSEVVA